MYEAEANWKIGSIGDLPTDVLARFAQSRATVLQRTLLAWGEHCTECVWPTCYSTCDIYQAREDGRCRRFIDGMVRIEYPESLNGYLLKIRFKRWAKLWSLGSLRLRELSHTDRIERYDFALAKLAQSAPFLPLQRLLVKILYAGKKRRPSTPAHGPKLPHCFLLECYNPASAPVSVTLTIRGQNSPIPFQKQLAMEAGFNRYRISIAEISHGLNLAEHFTIEIVPNEITDGCTLFFGALDFVAENNLAETALQQSGLARNAAAARTCKCVVWDLDNTVWDGVLIEDGGEKLKLRPHILEIFRTLDERGILLSVASKNNPEEAAATLKSFGLSEYILCPQISWGPKSQGIREIAHRLNIGIDSLLFVDDSAFEREEVKSALPEITVVDAANYLNIPERPDCQVVVTEESRKRRILYREQEIRNSVLQEFQGDYMVFLRDCKIHLTIRNMTEANLDRVYELTQRTNQMNFSGNRYTRDQLRELLGNPEIHKFVIDCSDRFGSYGTVGFCCVHAVEPRMTDLMFSCRIQSKRIEHAFLSFLLRRYRTRHNRDFYVSYRKTPRNTKQGKVFDDLQFEVLDVTDGVTELVYRWQKDIPEDGIVLIEDLAEKNAAVSRVDQ